MPTKAMPANANMIDSSRILVRKCFGVSLMELESRYCNCRRYVVMSSETAK